MDLNFQDEYIDDYSDDESSLSSNNDELPDIDIYLHDKYGTRHFKKSNESLDEKESVKSFQDAMKDELDEICNTYEDALHGKDLGLLDNPKQSIKQDEDLYDSHSDDENQSFVDDLRRANIMPHIPQSERHKKLPQSDAVLNCPCCMSLLCLDCQRHALYKTQYRAMFVNNCTIDESHNLYYPKDSEDIKGTKRRRKKKIAFQRARYIDDENNDFEGESDIESDTDQTIPSDIPIELNSKDGDPSMDYTKVDIYKRVLCEICKTEVGVFDTDEIYHFHNVLASYT